MRPPLDKLYIHDFFFYQHGENNAITDVPGVSVGHTTLIDGDDIRTGITAILPPELPDKRYLAGGHVLNANGEVTGLPYILEEGRLIGPILLTNTLSVGDVHAAVIDHYRDKVSLPVVGECWDGYLNDIWGHHITKDHVIQAIESASGGPVEQGNVGAGTGMMSFGFKAGIGTASRTLAINGSSFVVGVLVNNNMGTEDGSHRYLRINGKDIAKVMHEDSSHIEQPPSETHLSSSIVVIATNAPLNNRQLNRLAHHAVLGIGRVGFVSYTGSGDFILAFSTANQPPERSKPEILSNAEINETLLDTVFEATLEAVEESYINTLLTAEDMTGFQGHSVKALPTDILSD